MRVRRSGRLCNDVLNAQGFENGAHRTTRDHTRTRRRGPHHNLAGTEMAANVMVQGPPLTQRDANHRSLRLLTRLSDSFRHLTRLPSSMADPAVTIAQHNQRREAKALAALYHLRDTIDGDQLFNE